MTTNMTEELDILENIRVIMQQVFDNKEQQIQIDDLLSKRHEIPRGVFYELMINPDRFENLDKIEKIAFIDTIFEVTKDEKINPKIFFGDKEIIKAKKFKKETLQITTKPYTFGNYVIQSSESDYITSLKYKEVGLLWHSKILDWNPDIQRKPKEKINKKGEIRQEPKVIKQSVKEITDLMKRKRFRSNTITFCILMDSNSEITYESGELTLVSGDMYIIDGYHRLSGILNILEEEPDIDESIDVSIKYLTFDEARYYLGQINKMSKFDKSFVNYLMNDRIQDKIVTELERKSSLRGRITKEATVPKKKTYLTSFNVLSNGVKDIFEPQDNKDRIEIAETLAYFFDYLIDYYPEDFSKDLATLMKARDNSLRNYHNTFVVYLVIAKALHDKYGKGSNVPSDEIIRLVDAFDYSKDGEYAKVLFSEGTGKVNSNQVKRNIRKYAEDKVKEIL